ncbi:type IVB secretion system protein IcmH/DotU [Sphingomonas immobilis]|uniref:Type IVB secretion system protein IcmH/DotU n=1 Tax=Sphingomonas immobilis TaxID=3063997 RepID=A0ABT9A506_9SPHN|nr:type IVB secretion system protein IcmH/DotU [Sphingomonas sp. CA1-15]MDO7843817.1 type IVB secretion system protein IcmH/DotU [Sphingomonas sp. CA1-15]
MSGDNSGGGNKTVFRPSPLQGLKQGGGEPPPAQQQGWGAPPPPQQPAWGAPQGFGTPPAPPAYAPPVQETPGYAAPPPMSRSGQGPQAASFAPSRLAEDDVPLPATPRTVRNIMLTEAGPVLALAAGIRAGRIRAPMPQFHKEATALIAQFDRAIQPHYSEETRQRAKYAVCATIDDIAQNLPSVGTDGAEWARRSMVVQFFQENIGGDRFWQLVDDMLRTPADNLDIIELYHACLASGFEGRFRVMPDGKRRLHEIMTRLHGALQHVRSLSMMEMSPRWRGEKAPVGKLGFWSIIALAAAAALAFLLVVYIILRLILMSTADAPYQALSGTMPEDRLSMSRPAAAMPPSEGAQSSKLKTFLANEIAAKEVTVVEDGQTVRVRTTVGQLFESGSDVLAPGREALFQKIGDAVKDEKGTVSIEGHADTDKLSSASPFQDNMALSQARAETVGKIIRTAIGDPARVVTKGMGDTVPIAPNSTAAGKSQNRRVEVIVPRVY